MGMNKIKLNKKAMESTVIVIIIISLIILLLLLVFSGKAFGWINLIIDKMFGF